MKNIRFSLQVMLLTLFVSCNNTPKYEQPLWTKKEIDKFIVNWTLDNKKVFNWNVATDRMIYSALAHGDSYLYVTFKMQSDGPERLAYSDSYELFEEWIKRGEEIANFILKKEQEYRKQPNLSLQDIIHPHNVREYNQFEIQVTNPSTITALRADETVITVEPRYFDEEGVMLKMMSDSIKKRKERE